MFSRCLPGLATLMFAACGSPPAGIDAAPPSDGPPVPDAAAVLDAAPDGPSGTPDLVINEARSRVDLALATRLYAPDACELTTEEDCVAAPGERRLLHFAVETPNVGTGDLLLGPPDPGNGNFNYSECHEHYHFEGYAAYRLIDDEGSEVAVGRKQAFCLLDTTRYITDDPSVSVTPRYHCEYQGIQRGWSDLYHTRLPCQFIDVTGLPDGSYTLEIELNVDQTLEELDYGNNSVSIPIELGSADLTSPTEPCPDDIDARSSAGLHRECGWTLAGVFDCTPGSPAQVGCSSQCGLGSCNGNPMLRICDAARADNNCSYPAALEPNPMTDDFAGLCPCDLGVECPESGQIAVYTAPHSVGAAYECNLQVEP